MFPTHRLRWELFRIRRSIIGVHMGHGYRLYAAGTAGPLHMLQASVKRAALHFDAAFKSCDPIVKRMHFGRGATAATIVNSAWTILATVGVAVTATILFTAAAPVVAGSATGLNGLLCG